MKSKQPIAVLLINLGTPDSPATADVRRYLVEFLTDGRVIDIPWLPRQLLVRGIIAPFRAGNSAKSYKAIWTDRGSPLKFHSQDFTEALKQRLKKPLENYDNKTRNATLLYLCFRITPRRVQALPTKK